MSSKMTEEKIKEIQRKVGQMRASVPPKSLFNASFREDQNKKSRSGSLADVLQDDRTYLSIKTSFKGGVSRTTSESPTSVHCHSGLLSNSANNATIHNSPHRSENYDFSSSSKGSSTTSSPPPVTTPFQESIAEHPLVSQLSVRGLTDSMQRRKLQLQVRREVDAKLLLSSSPSHKQSSL